MSAPAIIDYLQRETGRFGDDIYKRMFATSPWLTLIQRDTWPDELGEVISNLTYERQAPTDAEPTWTETAIVDGAEGGLCLPAATKLKFGSTSRTYRLARRILEGPDICVENIRSSFQLRKQLDSAFDSIANYARTEWEIRDRHEYFRGCKHKVVVKAASLASTSTQAATYPAETAGALLTQGMLNKWKMKLIRDGAAQSAMGKADGAPILTLICSAETSEFLLRLDDDDRDDLRHGKPSELLAGIGVERAYRGFFHVIDPYPRRFSESGGVYTEVPAFVETSPTKGSGTDVNPDWEDLTAAPYEETFIFDPTVFKQLVPKPITAPGGTFKFDPIKYTGSWSLKNIIDRQDNPDGTIVYHRGHLWAASEPVHPERGVAFVHKRCDPAQNFVTTCP